MVLQSPPEQQHGIWAQLLSSALPTEVLLVNHDVRHLSPVPNYSRQN